MLSLNLVLLTRIIAAVLLGSIIGLERELTNKYAGLRTNLLVCLGSCIFTMLSIYAFPLAVDSVNPQAFGDPARIAAQVLTGIGFIGGGTVLRHGSAVYGLTTAATLWMAAAIGMACGTGMIKLAVIGTLICVLVLVGVRYIERNLFTQSAKQFSWVEIIATCQNEKIDCAHDFILSNIDNVKKISKERIDEDKSKIVVVTGFNSKQNIQNIYEDIKSVTGIENLTVQERNEQ